MPLKHWEILQNADNHARELLPLLREILTDICNQQSYAEHVLHDDAEWLNLDEQGVHVSALIKELVWFLYPAERGK